MPFPPISTGGRGAGFMLGPEQNVFTGADRAAAESARDTYFTANPSNLASYNADNSLNIRLEYSDGGDAIAQFQVRNTADSEWVDNDSAIGVRGDDGTATVAGADGTIPMIEGNALVASSLRETATQLEFDKNAMFPGGTISLEGFEVSNPGGQLLLRDTASNRVFGIPSRIFTEAGGSGSFTVDNIAPVVPNHVPFQSRNDELITITNEIGININELISALILEWRSAVEASAAGDFAIKIHRGTSASDPLVYSSHNASDVSEGNVFTLDGGNRIHDTRGHPLLMEAGQDYFVRFIAVGGNAVFGGTTTTQADVDDPATLFTVVGQQVPAFDTLFQQFTQLRVLTEDDLRTDEQVQDISAAMLTGGTHNGITVEYDDDAGVINLSVTGTTPPVSPDPGVSGLDIGVPATVDVGFNFNTTRDIRFTTTATAQIASLTLVITGADDINLAVPSTDGSHTQSVTFTGANTGVAGTITAQIRGTTTGGQTIMSNVETVNIRAVQAHELAYVWAATTQNFAAQNLSDPAVQSFDVSQPGTQFSVADLTVPDGSYINVMYPDNRPVTSIIEPPLNLESITEFPETTGVRMIASQGYNGRSDQNNAGASVSFSANITVGG